MKLPTSYIKQKTLREGVRFFLAGQLGIGIQYGIYYAFLRIFEWTTGDEHVSIAFTIGFVLEMITNYLFQIYYVFSDNKHPNWKNVSGFLLARGINYVLQMGLLEGLLWLGTTVAWLAWMNAEWAGIWSILISGIINFFIMKLNFRTKKNKHENLQSKPIVDADTREV